MRERFTGRANKVLHLANAEAVRFNHEYIGTEHVLLGLAMEGSGVATHVLRDLGVDVVGIRREIDKIVQKGEDAPPTMGKRPLTPRVNVAIEKAMEVAAEWGHNFVGTEHLLCGLVREGEGIAVQILLNLGATREVIEKRVRETIGAGRPVKESVTEPLTEPLTDAESAALAKLGSFAQTGWTDDELAVSILYTNHMGETAVRRIVPGYLWFGESPYHPGEQWLLRAKDCDRDGAERDFAMKDVRKWKQESRP